MLLILLCALSASQPAFSEIPAIKWKNIGKGVEFAEINFESIADGLKKQLHIVRFDPKKAKLELVLSSQSDKIKKTAGQCCKDNKMIAAINAGMYLTDHFTNVGYLRNGNYVQNGRWNKKYQSALAFGPRKKKIPNAVIIDMDTEGAQKILDNYDSVVQNLRLLKGDGISVWGPEDKKAWSEAAIAMDSGGRILFIFCRNPMTMYSFNNTIISLKIGVIKMMHVEGGPEANLSVHGGGIDLDLNGSYETGFDGSESNGAQWPIPNVLGIVK